MNPLEFIIPALENVFSVYNIIIIFAGLLIGVIVGCTPGLNVTMGVILMLPLTFGMESAASAIILLMAVYCGGVYGGSISAILLNMPGTVASIATTFDGYPLAKKGKAKKALNTALFGSVFGGIYSSIILLIFATLIAQFVGGFASPEYFALGVMGIMLVAGVSGDSLAKSVIGALVGVFIATIGFDMVANVQRFTFGSTTLRFGIDMVPTMIALIALTQILLKATEFTMNKGEMGNVTEISKEGLSRKEAKSIVPACIRSSTIASLVGAAPGIGGCVTQFLCYNEARRASKKPEEFGKGSLEGLAAAEASSNSVAGASLIPLLTLGIPGDGVTALLLGAFVLHGMQPGPAMFTNHGDTAYTIMIGKLVTAFMLIIIGLVFTRLVARIVRVRYSYLTPVIIMFCFAGAFAATGHIKEVTIAAGMLVLSYILNILKISVIPLMLGMILTPIMERNFITGMLAHGNDITIFVRRPVALGILLVTVVLTWSLLRVNRKVMALQAKAQKESEESEESACEDMTEPTPESESAQEDVVNDDKA